ncbi:MAG: 5'-nucleotidase C-terminal domain-containing protein [Ignavibacteriae bacterium]|nr:5'-nucleotidase C-terminal domain-containing protein [Ignavibacteriota bacterium]
MIKSQLRFKIIFLVLLITIISNIYAQTVNIKIIETSDVHGAIYPYNFNNNKPSKNSLAQVYTYVEKERVNNNQSVFLVDNGDILQGDPSVYYYNFEKTDTMHLLADVMNYMKYDVGTVENHDIETGHPVYDKFKNELNFPWLAANARNTETNEPYFQPYHILYTSIPNDADRKIKIAVLGLITPGIPNWLPKNIWSGIEFEDMILTAKKWIPIIQEKENPDILIGLFHAGTDFTYGDQNADSHRNENASQLIAEQVPGFAVVFVGHDHHEWNYKVKNSVGDSVLILGPPSRANKVTVANIKLEYNEYKKLWSKSIVGDVINLESIKPNEDFMKNFESEFIEVKNYVSRPIGKFTQTVSARNSLFGNSSFVDLIHLIQLELTDADVSFTAPLSINSKIDSGEVFVKDMFELYRYENLLYTMDLSGKEILDYLEYSYDEWLNTMKTKEDNLLQFEKDENGNIVFSNRSNTAMLKNRYYNFDSAEGIKYIVDVSKPNGNKVKIISMADGTNFDLNKKYKVAINSYRGNGGGGHLTKGAGIPQDELTNRIITSTEKDLRYYMMKWIESQKIVVPKEDLNWEIIPKDFVDKAKEKDYKLMFGDYEEHK